MKAYARSDGVGARGENGGACRVSVDIRSMVRQSTRSGGRIGSASGPVFQPIHELEALVDVVDRGGLVVDQTSVQTVPLDDPEGQIALDVRGLLRPGYPQPARRVERPSQGGEPAAQIGRG